MAAPRLSAKVIRDTVAAVKRCGGNRTHAAAEMGIPLATVGSRLTAAKRHRIDVPAPAFAGGKPTKGASLADELKVERKRTAVLEGKLEAARAAGRRQATPARTVKRSGKDDTLRIVFPDVHGCLQDRAAVGAMLADMRRLDPDEVIGLGDLIDAGGFLAQHHVWGFVAEATYTYEDDIRAGNLLLDAIQEAAPRARIDLIEGNHDQRPERWCVTQSLRSRIDAAFLMQHNAAHVLLGLQKRGIHYHRRSELHDGLSVQGTIRRGKCLFTHEAKQSIIHRYGTNVVHGHDHRVTSRLIHSVAGGTIGIWSLGCLSQRQPLWQHSTPTEWSHAFGVQIVARSGRFLHLTVPIIEGQSLLPQLKLG